MRARPRGDNPPQTLPALRTLLRVRMAAIAVAVGGVAFLVPSVASAQSAPTVQVPPHVMSVDARANTNATVIVRSTTPVTDPVVRVNDKPVDVTSVKKAGETGTKVNTVLLIDNSEDSGTFAFAQIKEAASKFLSTLNPNESIAVISLGGTARIEYDLSRNGAVAADVVNSLPALGATELWSGFTLASDLLASENTAVNNVIALVGSQDSGKDASVTEAISRSLTTRTAVNVIALRSGRMSDTQVNQLAEIAGETGGLMQVTSSPNLLPPLFAAAADAVRGLYAINIIGDPIATGGNIDLMVNGTPLRVGFIAGSVTRGANLAPYTASKPALGFFHTTKGKYLSLLLMFVAVGLAAWAILMTVVRDKAGLNSVLSPYTGDVDAESEVRHNAIFQRAVDITTSLAERRGLLAAAETKLEQAAMPLRAAEAITGYAVIVVVCFAGSALLTRNVIKVLIFTALGVLFPMAYVNFKISRRKKKFMAQLPDTLSLLAGTLKAGYSFLQGVEAVSQEVEDPMGGELRRVITEAQLGRPVEDALESAAARMDSDDFAWAVMAVKIQREVGGNLAELLMTVAETMTARSRLKGEIRALTAEGRMSAIILGILPPGVGFIMYLLNREYMQVLFHEGIGIGMIIASVISMAIGFAWMLKIINIKI